MKATLIVLLLLVNATAWAQGDAPDCEFCDGVRDYGCLAVADITSRTGCTSRNFTVSCAGTYTLTAKVECSGNYKCEKCLATVNVYSGDTFLGNCHTSNCLAGDCDEVCSPAQGAGVYLTAGTYTLWVGLCPCTYSQCGTGAITDCDTNNCSAVGYVKWSGNSQCPAR